jgi:hypothetical protein
MANAFAKYSWLRIITAEATNLSPRRADLKNTWLLILLMARTHGSNWKQVLFAFHRSFGV